MIYFLQKKLKLMVFLILILHNVTVYSASLQPNDIAEINFLNFTGVSEHFSLNGEAKIIPDTFSNKDEEQMILRLTPRKSNAEGMVAGSAFLKMPFVDKAIKNYSFSTFFRFRITANNIYDGSGVVFVIHADPRKDKALAKSTGGMGYSGYYLRGFKSITPSLGIKFNVQTDEENDIDYNTIGTVLNGNLDTLYPPFGYPVAENQLNNGIPWNVWIDYDGNFLTVRTTQSPEYELSTIHTKRQISLYGNLTKSLESDKQNPEVYVGFTADPGFSPAYHDILEWHFRPIYKPFGDYCGDSPEDRPPSCQE